jgi:hypothetical protein
MDEKIHLINKYILFVLKNKINLNIDLNRSIVHYVMNDENVSNRILLELRKSSKKILSILHIEYQLPDDYNSILNFSLNLTYIDVYLLILSMYQR